MNKQQWKDAKQCEQMAEQGKDKDCLGCSCNVCLAQVSTGGKLEQFCKQSGCQTYISKNRPDGLISGLDRKEYFETNVCPRCKAWQYVEFINK